MADRINREDRRPEEERGTQIEHVLHVVDKRILKGRIKQDRKVRPPHHRNQERPADERVADDSNDATLQNGEDARAPARRGDAQEECHRPRLQQQDRHREEQDQVLNHVHREEGRVVALDS